MSELVSGQEFTDLFRAYRHSAWRLETRRHYAAPGRDQLFADWLAGFDELNLLDRLAAHIPGYDHNAARRILFSRPGFSPRLHALAESEPRLTLVTPDDIYA